MKIETKFNIGNTIYYTHGSSIIHEVIRGFEIRAYQAADKSSGFTIYYQTNTQSTLLEDKLFTTKEEAGLAWLKAQGLDCGLKDSNDN